MKKIMTIKLYFCVLIIISVSVASARSYDPEAISQISKAIAEGKLMAKEKGDHIDYVSSSLDDIVKEGHGKRVGGVRGLSAFGDDNDYDWLKKDNEVAIINTARDTIVGLTPGRVGQTYSIISTVQTMNTMNNISNARTSEAFYQATKGTPVQHLGAAVKIANDPDIIKKIEQLSTTQVVQPSIRSDILPTYSSVDWNSVLQNSRIDWKSSTPIYKVSRTDMNTTAKTMGTDWNKISLGNTKISSLPSMPKMQMNSIPRMSYSSTTYLPPDKLFSLKNPLDKYRPSMLKMSDYSSYSKYRTSPSTFTRPTSYSWRNY
jgi:hypothetical protein